MRAILLFPLLAVVFSALAWLFPAAFTGLKPAIPWLLGVVMFGMGMTLNAESFAQVLKRPGIIGLGVALQFLVMPLAAWGISEALGLSAALLAGMVLVGASPGGTASNVICYLARGDVALSITLTTVSTLLAILATPLLTLLYAGQKVDVPALAMLWSVAKIVLLPVALGVTVNTLFGPRLKPVKQVFPALSIAAIVLIIAIVVALNADRLGTLGAAVVIAVVLHNAVGLAAGYLVARALGQDARTARTLAIEVGMQNSGLAVALAAKFFSPAAALPGAIFSIWHNLSGALLASLWSRRDRG
jgi:BASS family bile acid:Na+ symporter